MQPQTLLRADVGDRLERVDRAGGHRAGGGDHAERLASGGAVLADGCAQRVDVEPEAVVGGQTAQMVEAEAEQRGRLVDAAVRLLAGVGDQRRSSRLQAGRAKVRPPVGERGGEPDDVRHRSAVGDQPARLVGEFEQPAQPANNGALDHAGRRRQLPEVAVLVERGGDRLGVRGDPVRRPLHVGQEARVRDRRGVGDDRVGDLREEPLDADAPLRERAAQQRRQRVAIDVRHDPRRRDRPLVAVEEVGQQPAGGGAFAIVEG